MGSPLSTSRRPGSIATRFGFQIGGEPEGPRFFPDDETITFLDGGIAPRVFFIRIGEATPTMPGGGIVPGESGRLLLAPTRAALVLDGNSQGPGGLLSILDET